MYNHAGQESSVRGTEDRQLRAGSSRWHGLAQVLGERGVVHEPW